MRLIKGRSFYKEPWYGSYHSMMDRCYRETANNYPYYGGRGIRVCAEWHDITAFEKWVWLLLGIIGWMLIIAFCIWMGGGRL